ncbi:putative receptor protein kinase ZmPK1 [Morella rubra]|uniref:non-specific serine/threonine protein kinase n=1 Tax=Morella rubra TaxID=262757 RepID=A0A6A1W514_9ROSI|nr:putative receptor protein kinase ZmPK1 [Morella rubra]
MANRDQPVNGRLSKLSLLDTGDLILTDAGLRKFTYAELKKATKGFTEEIGRGAGGIVYRGVLSDNRVAAVKRLNVANQGEDIFLAEVSIIGRLNHMHLIEMWGYCAQGKHRLLVSEYMEHGSLAQNLASYSLDWKKRFEIALGTAKGLAYLHEECLEWVLHCDVKPENILLDSDYQPKVADFGLSKLQNRGDSSNSTFSRMRGTRGYMAPEWVFNLPVTSKVDVYSYGIVVLVMVTGKSTQIHAVDDAADRERKSLVTWVREKKNGEATKTCWIEDVIDPIMEGRCDMGKMEMLVSVALQCVEEDKNARPTMSQVVDILHHHKDTRH